MTSILILRVERPAGGRRTAFHWGRMVGYDNCGYNFAGCSVLVRLDARMASLASSGPAHHGRSFRYQPQIGL
ncbi:hypothetical protein AWT69_004527 [Pseudomonas putida]|nr:hypothetical protein AWT69_004527 [Pseudomonas putida]